MLAMDNRKVILFSAPSGCGKTTIIKHILQHFDCFEFSISATSRQPRGQEKHGTDYYFLSTEEFKARAAKAAALKEALKSKANKAAKEAAKKAEKNEK